MLNDRHSLRGILYTAFIMMEKQTCRWVRLKI